MRMICRMAAATVLLVLSDLSVSRAQEASYDLAVGRVDTHAYAVGVGISMLAKINLLPNYNIDLDVQVSENSTDNINRLMNGQADLAMINPADLKAGAADHIRAVAMVWQSGEASPLLAARRDVAAEAVYQIAKMIFENLPALQTVDAITADTNLDAAVSGFDLPL